jgi:hypothetical protein
MKVRVASIAAVTAIALSVALVACSSPATPPASSEAACETPRGSTYPATVHPGESVTVTGERWMPCDDAPNDASPAAWKDVTLTWLQNGAESTLGVAPLRDASFAIDIVIPGDVMPGEATVRVTAPGATADVVVTVEE